MAIVVPNEGELELARKMLKDALSTDEDYSLKLFANDYTPISTTTAADFTDPVFTGYAVKTLTRSDWDNPITLANGDAYSEYSVEQSWTCGATGDTVYGYYIEGDTSGKVLWSERLDTPAELVSGDDLKITPSFTFRSRGC